MISININVIYDMIKINVLNEILYINILEDRNISTIFYIDNVEWCRGYLRNGIKIFKTLHLLSSGYFDIEERQGCFVDSHAQSIVYSQLYMLNCI